MERLMRKMSTKEERINDTVAEWKVKTREAVTPSSGM